MTGSVKLYSPLAISITTSSFVLSESFSEGEVSKASGLMAERMKLSDNNPAVFEDTVRSMRAERDRMSHSGEGGIDVINEILKAKKNN